MTAAHVGSLSAKPVAPKAVSTNAPEMPGAPPFRQHLQDARGHGSAAAHDAHPQRGPDPARDRRDDPSPQGPDSRQSSPGSARLDKPADAAKRSAQAADAATAPTPPPTAPRPPGGETVVDVAAAEPASVGKDGDDEDGATALVEAMLALISPAVGKLATPAGAAAAGVVDAAAAKLAAAQAGLVALTPTGAATTPAIDPAALALAAAPAAERLKLDPDTTREAVRLDAAPATAPSTVNTTAAPAPTGAPVPVAPAHAFAQELGQQVAWSVGHDIKQARIRLHPEELGSLDLKISVQHNRVDVVFHAQHPGAVTAVQQSLPQLDQMLAQHGLSLGHAEVGQHDRGEQGDQRGHGEEMSGVDEATGPAHVTPLTQLGLVDAFA